MKDYLGIFHEIFREFIYQELLGKLKFYLKYINLEKGLKKYLTYIYNDNHYTILP